MNNNKKIRLKIDSNDRHCRLTITMNETVREHVVGLNSKTTITNALVDCAVSARVV